MPVDVTRLHGLLRPDQVDTIAPLTLRATKEAFRRLHQDVDPSDADLIAACSASADFRAGVRAFQEKRAPNWTGPDVRPFRIESEGVHDVVAPHGVSTSSHPLATAAGAEMLLRGGNAVDASPA